MHWVHSSNVKSDYLVLSIKVDEVFIYRHNKIYNSSELILKGATSTTSVFQTCLWLVRSP